ncbi:hypothetical protein M8818_006021 [Zalaria obscura]|uniref:Uncharacterized protein n=1 Tax=Zalaria obscura TaxID=2024903 RepID=A0ACC3S7D7_9PEZI
MPVRLAQYADLLPASKLLATAFFDEDLFGSLMHPHRNEYPDEVYLTHLSHLRQGSFSPCATVIVSHAPETPRTITGVAVWEWKGRKADELESSHSLETWWKWGAGKAMTAWEVVEGVVWPNRALDPEQKDVLERSYPFIEHYWEVPERKECYYLALCGVDPKAQGKGYGKELVQWGLAKAEAEGVCCGLISALGKEPFYRKCGFGEQVGWASEGEGNPIKDVPGGAILFTLRLGKRDGEE